MLCMLRVVVMLRLWFVVCLVVVGGCGLLLPSLLGCTLIARCCDWSVLLVVGCCCALLVVDCCRLLVVVVVVCCALCACVVLFVFGKVCCVLLLCLCLCLSLRLFVVVC